MKILKQITFLVLCFFLIGSLANAQGRMRDDEVKKVIEESMKTSDKFRDAFKKVSTITTQSGVQVDVKQYMDDYKQTFERFKSTFESKGAPTSDFLNLLRMTNEIDGVMTRNPDAAGAGSEWQAHKFNMDKLAKAFRTSLGEGAAPPSRLSDDQLGSIMTDIKSTSQLIGKNMKDAMKKDAAMDKTTRQANEQSLKALEKKAELVGKLYKDNKPFSVEMQDLVKHMDTVKGLITDSMGSAVHSDWDRLEKKVKQVTDEYGM